MPSIAIFDLDGYAGSMPALTSLIECLLADGCQLDVFTNDSVARELNGSQPRLAAWPVSVLCTPYGVGRIWGASRWPEWFGWRLNRIRRYDAVIGVDHGGMQAALSFSRRFSCTCAFYSFHIAGQFDAAQSSVLGSSDLILVQDETRGRLIARSPEVKPERLCYLPNAPLGEPRRKRDRFFHELFKLPPEAKVALFAGSFCDGHGLHLLLASVASWPQDWVLVLHCRYDHRRQPDKAFAMRVAQGLCPPGKVLVSGNPVPQKDIRTIFDSADAGFALYNEVPGQEPTALNNRLIGHSSAKFASALQAGLPVIVNDYTNLPDIVSRHACGVVVSSPSEIGPALAGVAADADRYAAASVRAFREEFDFKASYEKLRPRLWSTGR